MPFPLAGALIGAGLTVASNVWSAREAAKNREFQERMSSTAHQREVADLRSAGLNPILSANRGASAPSGAQGQIDDVGRGAQQGTAAAIAVQQARAELELTRAQTARERSQAQLTGMQASELGAATPLRLSLLQGDISLRDAQTAVARANQQQLETLLPTVLERAREEIRLTANSARRAGAQAVLEEAARAGAFNAEQFEREIGEKGPWVRLFMELMRSYAPLHREMSR